MIKWKNTVSTGLLLSVLTTISLAGVHGDSGAAYAAATMNTKSLAAVYAAIQTQNASKIVVLVNKERVRAGLKPLTVHTNLTKVAKAKAKDMYLNNYFSHTSPTYGSPFEMMDASSITYLYAGENLAMGQRSAEQAMKDWMKSPGHKKNILNPNFNLIGVGYFNGYWVQEFVGK